MTGDRTIEEMMVAFLDSLNAEYTQKTYATPLRHFATFLQGREVHVDRDPVDVLTVDHAIEFVPWLRYEHFPDPDQPAKATLQLYLTAVYRFYRSLLKRGMALAAADIARLEETYRDARNIRGEPRPKDPKLSAVEAIIQAARSIPAQSGDKAAHRQRELSRLRDIAIVETLRSTGCRVGELIGLRRVDLDWLARSALVKGKGSKYRKVYLDGPAWRAVKTYLQARADGGDARALSRQPVFSGHGNRSGRAPSPLTTRHVARIIRSLSEKAGIAEVGVSPHYFRHVFATRALDQTENLALVQDMLGHASPATTRVYARTDEEQRREGYARVWAEGGRMEHSVQMAAFEVEAVGDEDGQSLTAAEELRRAAHDLAGRTEEVCEYAAHLEAALTVLVIAADCSLAELTEAARGDVDPTTRRLRLRSADRAAVFGRERSVLLDDEVGSILAAYLDLRDSYPAPGVLGPDVLFCRADGAPLDAEEALALVTAFAAGAGVSEGEVRGLL